MTDSFSSLSPSWTRRDWLLRNSAALLVAANPALWSSRNAAVSSGRARVGGALSARVATQAQLLERGPLEELAKRAIDAARTAGASYADARLTRVVHHFYYIGQPEGDYHGDSEIIGVGVRALVNGYWGFSASPIWESDEVVRLARDAVAQAQVNAKTGTPRVADMGKYPVVTGTWATPIDVDPFTVTIEEKSDYIDNWVNRSTIEDCTIDSFNSYIQFIRQERIVATSDGSCFSQTQYESGGKLVISTGDKREPSAYIQGINMSGKGWELFLNAKILEQLSGIKDLIDKSLDIPAKIATVGRYTLVCDGNTMARIVEQTFGLATQLDRALGYEANSVGTSYIDDPLAMVGNFKVASPLVTVTANRSAPAQLASVKWDDEGIEPAQYALVKNGILADFQTTREQATWLAPYYAKHGHPVQSRGCAAAENALVTTMQHMPNLAMQPHDSSARLDDLVANVKDGILLTDAHAGTDHQARNGLLQGSMRGIINGKLGPRLYNGVVQFNTMDLWRRVVAVGGHTTQGVVSNSQYDIYGLQSFLGGGKGQPSQMTSHSMTGVAATIENQPVIDMSRIA